MVDAMPTTWTPSWLSMYEPGLRAVAADHHHALDAALGEVAQRLGPAALLAEFRRSGAAQERAADLDDAAHVARTELAELTVDQALPALAHAVHRHALIERAARDGADGRIHAGRVATTRKDRDVLHESEIMTVCPADRQKKCRLATIVRKMPLTNRCHGKRFACRHEEPHGDVPWRVTLRSDSSVCSHPVTSDAKAESDCTLQALTTLIRARTLPATVRATADSCNSRRCAVSQRSSSSPGALSVGL